MTVERKPPARGLNRIGSGDAVQDERETPLAERPRYRRMRAIFLRAMGAVYLTAFGSLQADDCLGRRAATIERRTASSSAPIPPSRYRVAR